MRRVTLVALVVLIVGSSAGGATLLAQPLSAGCSGGGAITTMGRWDHIRLPSFSDGPAETTEYSVDPADPQRLLITNGQIVQYSGDGGCTWQETFVLDAADGGEIVDLATGPNHAILAIRDPMSPRPRVVISGYGGETWRETDDGLEGVIGTALGAGFNRSNPRYAHLLVQGGVGDQDVAASSGYQVLQSSSAGAAWEDRGSNSPSPSLKVPGGATLGDDEALVGLVPDPQNAGRAYAYGSEGVVSYEPSLREPILSGDVVSLVAIRPPVSSTTTLLVAMRGSRGIRISSDDGRSFSEIPAPVQPDSFAEGLRVGEFFMSGEGRVFVSDARGMADISPDHGGPMIDLNIARTRETLSSFEGRETVTLYGRTATTLERTTVERIFDLPGAIQPADLDLLAPLEVSEQLPSLLPQDTSVSLKAGETKAVPYRFSMPALPSPLDVFFDVDVSSSMQEEIDGLRKSMAEITNELTMAGIDVWFGAGQYRAYDDPPGFQRLQDVAPPGPELAAALNRMVAQGGGLETQLESLYQIATGAGSREGAGIAPDQDASWRPGSVRVVVHITDETISEGKPHPNRQRVTDALRSDRIVHFGIAVQNAATALTGGTPLPGLMRISRESGSLAPPGGADCDGDGALDLYQGEPLVCVVDPLRTADAAVLGTAIINVLKAVSDFGELQIRTTVNGTESEPGEPLAVPSASVIGGIDFKKPTDLGFDITYSCPAVERRVHFPIRIQVERASGIVASANASLTCIPKAAHSEDKPRPPLLPPILPMVGIAPPPVRPPEPLQNPRPNPNPNPNPAQQGQAQGQGAAAVEQQEEPQLAVVRSRTPRRQIVPEEIRSNQEAGVLYLSSSRRAAPVDLPYLLFIGAALAVSGVFLGARTIRERTDVFTECRR